MGDTKMIQQLGQDLVDRNLLSGPAFESIMRDSATIGTHPARALVEAGGVDRTEVLRAIADRMGLSFFDPGATQPDSEALAKLDQATATGQVALPLRLEGPEQLVVAVPDPLNRGKLELLAKLSRCRMIPALGPEDALVEAIEQAYSGPLAPPEPVPHEEEPARSVPTQAPLEVKDDDPGYHVNVLLELLIDTGASDLHLTAGSPPQMRLHGHLEPIEGYGRLMPAQLQTLIYAILTSRQREVFENEQELDCSHPVAGKGRFRVNVFFQRGSIGSVMRAIPEYMMSLEDLGMPPVVAEFATLPRGLVLVTGATGSGKSTTLASLIDLINETRPVHVMTVEDPIEFMHRHKRAIVNQREVGSDTEGFARALRHALRQDPDVILVGELRDLETMETALTAAETGHLVFATLHTQDAPGSVERMIDVFPPHQQQQVRVQLAGSLQGVVSQQLLPRVDTEGRAAAIEVMVATPAIRNLIREGKVHQIRSSMQAGGQFGMQTMEHSLAQLVRSGRVSLAEATERANSADELMNLLGGRP